MEVPLNHTFEKQQKQLIPKTFRKAYISAVNIFARTADIYFANNTNVIIRNVPVASNIFVTDAMVGQKCKVDIFDEINQRDMVIAYCYGSSAGAAAGFTGSFSCINGLTIDFFAESYNYNTQVVTVVNGVITIIS